MPTDFAAATASKDRVIESCFRGYFFQASFWPKLVKWLSIFTIQDITDIARQACMT